MNTASNARRNVKNERSTTQRYLTTRNHRESPQTHTHTHINKLGSTKRGETTQDGHQTPPWLRTEACWRT
jgi:hypothetical protein